MEFSHVDSAVRARFTADIGFVAAWSNGLNDPTIVELAGRYKVTSAQVIYAWHIARGISFLARSANEGRQKEALIGVSQSQVFQATEQRSNRHLASDVGARGCAAHHCSRPQSAILQLRQQARESVRMDVRAAGMVNVGVCASSNASIVRL